MAISSNQLDLCSTNVSAINYLSSERCPHGIIILIFKNLSIQDLCIQAQVSKIFNMYAYDAVLWNRFAKQLEIVAEKGNARKRVIATMLRIQVTTRIPVVEEFVRKACVSFSLPISPLPKRDSIDDLFQKYVSVKDFQNQAPDKANF
jgi:hypothetical protein